MGVVDHHVGDVERSRLVVGLRREMEFGFVSLEDHEADGITILEGLHEAERLGIEVVSSFDILHGKHSGDSTEANAVDLVWFIA
jgi:hypothetical protein